MAYAGLRKGINCLGHLVGTQACCQRAFSRQPQAFRLDTVRAIMSGIHNLRSRLLMCRLHCLHFLVRERLQACLSLTKLQHLDCQQCTSATYNSHQIDVREYTWSRLIGANMHLRYNAQNLTTFLRACWNSPSPIAYGQGPCCQSRLVKTELTSSPRYRCINWTALHWNQHCKPFGQPSSKVISECWWATTRLAHSTSHSQNAICLKHVPRHMQYTERETAAEQT